MRNKKKVINFFDNFSIFHNKCKDKFWILNLKGKQTQA